jgi:hypothetical protein
MPKSAQPKKGPPEMNVDIIYVAEINGKIIEESASYDKRVALQHVADRIRSFGDAEMFAARLVRLSVPSCV